ncbi:MAG: hypothetical protein H0V66_14055 [Bdellovibrionales bacterium]|nr:hypothetical protein [Bdellovibrionales bacterium]
MIFIFLSLLTSCSSIKPRPQTNDSDSDVGSNKKIKNLEEILDRAETQASPEGKSILTTSREMIAKKEVVVGSCWDYINAVYNRSNYPEGKRVTALKSKIVGPFADVSMIQPGDWLYFINHSYSERDHSGVFVEWVNLEKKRAIMMSYKGGKHKTPATYRIYSLRNVYYIIRPK